MSNTTVARIANMEPREKRDFAAKSARGVCLVLAELLDQAPLDLRDLEALRNRQRELLDCLNVLDRALVAVADTTKAQRAAVQRRMTEAG
jgi:hypothetical protein